MRFMKIFLIIFITLSYQLYAQNKFGFDIPIYFSKSLVSVPGVFSSIEASGGGGTDFGLGMYLKVSESFKLKGGIHFWNKIFNPSHTGEYTVNGSNVDGKIEEEGKLRYVGLYILANYEKEVFFIGGGFDIAFSNSYKSDIYLYNSNDELIAESKGNNESFLTDTFNNQFDLLLNLGFKIKVTDRITLKPSSFFTIPVSKLFDTNVTVYNPVYGESSEAAFNIFLVKFGISTEISL